VSFKVNTGLFVEGRNTYVDNIPLLSVFARLDSIEDDPDATETDVPSFAAGWFDGLLADIRLAGKNAREEIDARPADNSHKSICTPDRCYCGSQ
jgi:hypothetical protein